MTDTRFAWMTADQYDRYCAVTAVAERMMALLKEGPQGREGWLILARVQRHLTR